MRFLPSRSAVVQAAALLLFARAICLGQQNPNNSPTTDQPSASPAAQAANKTPQASPQSSEGAALELITRRSIFFPDIARTPGPLDPEEKFKLFVNNSVSGQVVLFSVVSAGIGQARDSLPNYGQGFDGYAKRFGSSMASGATSNLFSDFILPSVLHQDPRFFVLANQGFGGSVKYALRRVVMTRSDTGQKVVNWSGLMGPLASETIADAYLPVGSRSPGQTFSRYGIDLAGLAVGNILREYWPRIFKKLKASGMPLPADLSPTPAPPAPSPAKP